MEIEKKIVSSVGMTEKEVETPENENRKQHRRGGIRTLPFILGEPSL